jgi:hypothetical protein
VAASWNAAKKARMFGGIWVGRESYSVANIGAMVAGGPYSEVEAGRATRVMIEIDGR